MNRCLNILAQRKYTQQISFTLYEDKQFAAFCLYVRTLPIDFASLGRKRKYIKSKTTGKLREKRTSIATVRDILWTFGTFPTFLLSRYRLPLKTTVHGVGETAENQGENQGSRKPSVLVGFLHQKKDCAYPLWGEDHVHPCAGAYHNISESLCNTMAAEIKPAIEKADRGPPAKKPHVYRLSFLDQWRVPGGSLRP